MNISLAVPNLMSSKTFLQPPLGLCSAAARLRSNGHKVTINDFRTSKSTTADAVASIPSDADLCVVSTSPYDMMQMYHSDYRLRYCIEFIKKLVQSRPDLPVAVCGAHGTLKPKLLGSQIPGVIILRWEIDHLIGRLALAMETGESLQTVPNLALWSDGGVYCTEYDDELAHPEFGPDDLMPAWDLVDLSNYFGYELHGERYLRLDRWGVLQGSRGCPWACNFCYNFWGGKVRYRSPAAVAKELDFLEKDRCANRVFFLDSNFTLNRDWALKVCAEIASLGSRLGWLCQTRCDLIDDRMLSAMKNSGCVAIQFGIEAYDDKVLHNLNKKITSGQVREAINATRKAGISPAAFVMLGTPFDSNESAQSTLEYLTRERVPFIPILYSPRLGSFLGDEIWKRESCHTWEDALRLRGRISGRLELIDLIESHKKARGRSFGGVPKGAKQSGCERKEYSGHRSRFESAVILKGPYAFPEKFALSPSDKQTSDWTPFVSLPITEKCTFRCVYCGIGGENTISPQSTFTLEDIIDTSLEVRSAGINKIRLTGGEPLLHGDIGEILRFLTEEGFYTLLNTNASFVTQRLDAFLRPSSNLHVAVSLDTLRKDRFNQISQSTGFYDNVLEGIELLGKLGLLMRINMVVGSFNLDEVPDMIEFCRKKGCDLKLQEVASVPYPHGRWQDIHVDFRELEAELCRCSTVVLQHPYASAFGVPVAIYDIDGVYVTVKAFAHGSRFDKIEICKGCSHFPCQEGLYDIYVLGDRTIAPCRWRRFGGKGRFRGDLSHTIQSFRRAIHITPDPVKDKDLHPVIPVRPTTSVEFL